MANPIPTLSVVSYKGAGNVRVDKLLNGLALDPTQDGSDVLTGTLENPSNFDNNCGNRIVEAFGLRLLLHGDRVYERDQGGAGNWGVVFSGPSATRITHSGLHLLFPDGVPTVAFLNDDGTNINKFTSIDGVTWVGPTIIASATGTFQNLGASVVFRDSIAWQVRRNTTPAGIVIHDFKLLTTITPATGQGETNNANMNLLVHQNKLFVCFGQGGMNIRRLDGTAFTFLVNLGSFTSGDAVPVMFSDGEEIIIFYRQFSAPANRGFAILNPTGSVSTLDIGSTVLSTTANIKHGWHKYVSIDPDPTQPTVYLWFNQGANNVGSFDLFRYNYRRITHGSVSGGPFEVGESVQDQTSNATARIMESSGTDLNLTDVVGTFGNGNVIQQTSGTNSGTTATSSSTLNYLALTSLGNGIFKANFGLPDIADGGLDRIPVATEARPQLDGLPVEEAGGRKRFFRVYGSGAIITLSQYHSTTEGEPDMLSTLVAGSIAIESGAPVTTPTNTTTQITNLTPDAGATLYSYLHDTAADNITPGTQFTLLLDIV